jgi:hypothetical protein
MENKKSQKLPETLTWKADSHDQPQRSLAWYIGFGLVSGGLIIFGIYTHSILTIITFCVIIVALLVFLSQSPRTITYKATKTGLVSGNTVYPYKIIKIFWIVYNPPTIKTINFETTAYLNNQISFQLGSQNPIELKWFLSQYLPEDLDRTESFTETLARSLKI